MSSTESTVSVIIRSASGDVAAVRASLARQTYRDFTVKVVIGVAPAARARNLGVAATTGELVLFVDDDASFGHLRVLECLVQTLTSDGTIGVVGPVRRRSPHATGLQRRIAAEQPRWEFPVPGEDAESNPPLDRYGYTDLTTTCCLLRRDLFDRLGGFDEDLVTGEDTDLFFRLRRAGFRLVVPARTWVDHDPPRRLRALMRKTFRYGEGHALEARAAPERNMAVVPLDRWYGKAFLALSPGLLLPSLFISVYLESQRKVRFGFRPIKALTTYATLYGYAWRWYRPTPVAP